MMVSGYGAGDSGFGWTSYDEEVDEGEVISDASGCAAVY